MAEEKVLDDSWFAMYMMNAKIGWSHDRTVQRDEGGKKTYVTSSVSEIKMNRMGTVIEISESSVVVEDENGALVSFEQSERQSAMEKKTAGRLEGGKIVWTTTVGKGEAKQESADWTEGILCPYAALRFRKSKGLEAGVKYSTREFLSKAPDAAAEVAITVKGREDVDVMGEKKNLVRLEMRMKMKGMNIPMVTWVSSEWTAWKINSMGVIDMFRLPKELAQAKGEVKEVFVQTIVSPDRKIENPRAARRLKFRLEMDDDEILATLPQGGCQKTLEKGPGFAVLETIAAEPAACPKRPVKAEGMEAFLKASTYLDKDDAKVKELAEKAAGSEEDSLAAARKIEKWVCDNIKKKNFGVGFATASEVARNLEGDCSEHAVLLAAMCRAAGIPSRVLAGVVYADFLATRERPDVGGFGFHMWAEVWVGEWVALDATIGAGYADATHIALARSGLESESSMFELVPIGTYLGRLKIKVLGE